MDNLPLLGEAETLSHQIQKVSDLYIQKSSDIAKIWHITELTNAYISYFLPLNMLRISSVIHEARHRNFFDGIKHVIDFGSGPGTFDLTAFTHQLLFDSYLFVELQKTAVTWHQKLLSQCLQIDFNSDKSREWSSQPNVNVKHPHSTLAVFSYSLNEIQTLPAWAYNVEALMIVEPSQQYSGRELQKLRQKLIERGFSIWAPCTHQALCPLQEHSKSDWCHNRIHVELSKSLQAIERYLPIKNQTLTYSYLLARKTPAPITNEIRLIGDTLYERGKVKQALCRGDKREFLTWLTRYGEPEPLPRGARMTLPANTEERGNEIRMPPKD